MGCYSVTQDFSYVNPSERKLFAGVEPETSPIPVPMSALRRPSNIFTYVYGEEIDDVELEATFNSSWPQRKPPTNLTVPWLAL